MRRSVNFGTSPGRLNCLFGVVKEEWGWESESGSLSLLEAAHTFNELL